MWNSKYCNKPVSWDLMPYNFLRHFSLKIDILGHFCIMPTYIFSEALCKAIFFLETLLDSASNYNLRHISKCLKKYIFLKAFSIVP
jgi:hypothetical protein